MQNLIGLLLPPLIDLINTSIEDTRIRFLVSFGVCALLGSAMHVVTNNGFLDSQSLIDDIFVVFGLSQVTYHAMYKDSALQNKIREE